MGESGSFTKFIWCMCRFFSFSLLVVQQAEGIKKITSWKSCLGDQGGI